MSFSFAPYSARTAVLLLLLTLPLAVGCTTDAGAQPASVQQAFKTGNQRYAAGDYQGALEAYRQALDAGYASGALYINMGNAHFRLDELGHAVRYYEQARRYLPGHLVLQHNLSIAHDRTADQFTPAPTSFWASWRNTAAALGAAVFFWPGLVLYGLALTLLGHHIWTGSRNPWHRRALLLSLLSGLLLLAVAFSVSLRPALDRRAVVVEAEVPLRQEPFERAAIARSLHEGTLLNVLRTDSSWVEVRLPNGTVGWIDRQAIVNVDA